MKKNILIGITGSIAAYKVYDLVRELTREEYALECVVTKGGERFINRLTLETLVGKNIYTDLFDHSFERKALHVPLAQWAELVIIVPATADILAKAACGIADELLTSLLLATQAPIMAVPAMHSHMWTNSMTQRNVKTLQDTGYIFVGPEEGTLSDGTKGIGHIASQEAIIKAIRKNS